MRHAFAIATAAAMLLHGAFMSAQGQERLTGEEKRLTGEEIRRAFEGNTVSGRFVSGKFFTEYHDPNGQAVGYNGTVPNTDACWIVKDDQICYYYGPPERRRVHCYRVQPIGRAFFLHHTVTSRSNAVVTAEPGNPRHHSDNGKPWYCDGLISRAPEQGEPLSRRLAAR